MFAAGEGRRRRPRGQWQVYADDIAIRTGRVIDEILDADDGRKAAVTEAKGGLGAVSGAIVLPR